MRWIAQKSYEKCDELHKSPMKNVIIVIFIVFL